MSSAPTCPVCGGVLAASGAYCLVCGRAIPAEPRPAAPPPVADHPAAWHDAPEDAPDRLGREQPPETDHRPRRVAGWLRRLFERG